MWLLCIKQRSTGWKCSLLVILFVEVYWNKQRKCASCCRSSWMNSWCGAALSCTATDSVMDSWCHSSAHHWMILNEICARWRALCSSALGADLCSRAITLRYLIPGQVKLDGTLEEGLKLLRTLFKKKKKATCCSLYLTVGAAVAGFLGAELFRNNGKAAASPARWVCSSLYVRLLPEPCSSSFLWPGSGGWHGSRRIWVTVVITGSWRSSSCRLSLKWL